MHNGLLSDYDYWRHEHAYERPITRQSVVNDDKINVIEEVDMTMRVEVLLAEHGLSCEKIT